MANYRSSVVGLRRLTASGSVGRHVYAVGSRAVLLIALVQALVANPSWVVEACPERTDGLGSTDAFDFHADCFPNGTIQYHWTAKGVDKAHAAYCCYNLRNNMTNQGTVLQGTHFIQLKRSGTIDIADWKVDSNCLFFGCYEDAFEGFKWFRFQSVDCTSDQGVGAIITEMDTQCYNDPETNIDVTSQPMLAPSYTRSTTLITRTTNTVDNIILSTMDGRTMPVETMMPPNSVPSTTTVTMLHTGISTPNHVVISVIETMMPPVPSTTVVTLSHTSTTRPNQVSPAAVASGVAGLVVVLAIIAVAVGLLAAAKTKRMHMWHRIKKYRDPLDITFNPVDPLKPYLVAQGSELTLLEELCPDKHKCTCTLPTPATSTCTSSASTSDPGERDKLKNKQISPVSSNYVSDVRSWFFTGPVHSPESARPDGKDGSPLSSPLANHSSDVLHCPPLLVYVPNTDRDKLGSYESTPLSMYASGSFPTRSLLASAPSLEGSNPNCHVSCPSPYIPHEQAATLQQQQQQHQQQQPQQQPDPSTEAGSYKAFLTTAELRSGLTLGVDQEKIAYTGFSMIIPPPSPTLVLEFDHVDTLHNEPSQWQTTSNASNGGYVASMDDWTATRIT